MFGVEPKSLGHEPSELPLFDITLVVPQPPRLGFDSSVHPWLSTRASRKVGPPMSFPALRHEGGPPGSLPYPAPSDVAPTIGFAPLSLSATVSSNQCPSVPFHPPSGSFVSNNGIPPGPSPAWRYSRLQRGAAHPMGVAPAPCASVYPHPRASSSLQRTHQSAPSSTLLRVPLPCCALGHVRTCSLVGSGTHPGPPLPGEQTRLPHPWSPARVDR